MLSQLPNRNRRRSGWRSWISTTTLAIALTAALAWLVGWIGLAVIHQMSTESLEARLNSEVETCVLALETWLDDQQKTAQSWAGEAGVQNEIVEFMNSPIQRDWQRDRVLASDELKGLRRRLSPVCKSHGFVGFVVIDRQGRQVATLLDDALGLTLDAKPLETIHRVF